MPALTSGKVLVTGVNSYVAAWVVQDLLDHGFSVRGTVRSESKTVDLRSHFKAYGDKLEFAIVPDIGQEGAFDGAANGVDAIVHLAAPVSLTVDDPDDIIRPTVNSTVDVLRSALKHRATVKRIVILSSSAAMWSPPPPGHASFVRELDERDWNEVSITEVREKGRDASGWDKYRAGKTLAERAAWELYEREKSKPEGLPWDLVVLHPPSVFGPTIANETPTPEGFNLSARTWYNHVVKGALQGDALTKNGGEFVDVRDLARAHLLALTVPEAGGERFIIRGHSFVWQEFVDAARRFSDKVPVGNPSYNPEDAVYPVRYNSAKSQRVLGLKYRALEETARDTVEDLRTRGWL